VYGPSPAPPARRSDQALQSSDFERAYLSAVEDILKTSRWSPELQREFSRHCVGWSPERFDFGEYLRKSLRRYQVAIAALDRAGGLGRICDVGGFFGAFPLALARLGHDVSMTEALRYYSKAFHPLFDYLRDEGVKIIDWDPFERALGTDHGRFNTVTLMAVLEHYPHSPEPLLRNLRSIMSDRSSLWVEVPNIAFWTRRVNLLRGRTPLVPIADKWNSATPFIGHHHEYTMDELERLVTLAGLPIRQRGSFNYSLAGSLVRRMLTNPVQTLATSVLPGARECLYVVCDG